MRRRLWSTAIATLAAAGLLVVGGCGGEDGAETDDPAVTTQAPANAEEPSAGTQPESGPAAEPEPPPPPPPPRPLPGLPADTAGFEDWTRLNSQPIPPDSADSQIVGFDAHRSTKNVYVNRPREQLLGPRGGQRLPYPDGTILVKEGSEDGVMKIVAVMRKIAGVDPEHGDWQFIEWKRDAADQPFVTSPSLQDATCWSCHSIVTDRDWVFTALEP